MLHISFFYVISPGAHSASATLAQHWQLWMLRSAHHKHDLHVCKLRSASILPFRWPSTKLEILPHPSAYTTIAETRNVYQTRGTRPGKMSFHFISFIHSFIKGMWIQYYIHNNLSTHLCGIIQGIKVH